MYKKVIQKYRERTILKRIFLCTFGISAFFITIACFIGFSWVQRLKMDELIKNDREVLSNYHAVMDNNLDSAQKTLETLFRNVYVKRMLINNEVSWNDNTSVVANSIVTTVSVNPNLHSIYIFGEDGILLKSSNYKYPTTKEVDMGAEKTFVNSYLTRMNPWSYKDIYGEELKILSLTIGDFSGKEKVYENGIALNMDIGSITDRLFSDTVSGENFILLSEEGKVLAESSGDYMFGENIANEEFVSTMLEKNENEGMFKFLRNKVKYTVSYIRSNDGYYYIMHIYPYSTMLNSIAYSRNLVIVAGILLMFVSLLTSAFVAFKVYHPIDEVMEYLNGPEEAETQNAESSRKKYKELSVISEKMRFMARQLNHFSEEKETDYMIHYLSSRHYNSKVPAVFLDKMKEMEEASYYCAVLRICNLDKVMNEVKEADILEQINTICEIAKSSYENIAKVLLYVIDSEFIAAILISQGDSLTDSLFYSQSERIIDSIRQQQLIHINIGLSGKNTEDSKLYQVYQTAKAITKYRFLFGENAIITEEQIQNCSFGGSHKDFDLRDIICSVKKQDKQWFIKEFELMMVFIKEHSLQTGYDLLISLACEMFLYHNEITQYRSSLGFLDYENAQKEVLSFEYIDEALPWFLILFEKIQDTIGEAQRKGSGEIVEKAVKYIMEHYKDTSLSAQYLADKFNITPSYFSRIFNDYTNCAFPDYLTNIRLEQAKKRLIEEPSISIQAICEEVGYLNSSYFTAQFKKKYGIPPSKYRLNNHIK